MLEWSQIYSDILKSQISLLRTCGTHSCTVKKVFFFSFKNIFFMKDTLWQKCFVLFFFFWYWYLQCSKTLWIKNHLCYLNFTRENCIIGLPEISDERIVTEEWLRKKEINYQSFCKESCLFSASNDLQRIDYTNY